MDASLDTLGNPADTANPIPATGPALARPSISWGSALGGAAAALGVQIGLSQLCMSFGLALYKPADPGSSISTITISGAVALVVSAMVALFVGGWVAGRLARHASAVDAAIHGGLVWSLYGIVVIMGVATAAGALAGGGLYLVGEGVNALATGAAAAAPAAKELVAPTWDAVKTQVEGETVKADKAKPADERLAERSQLMDLLASSFSTDSTPEQKQKEKPELITLLASQTGVSQAAAGHAYEQWQHSWEAATARYEAAKLKAEMKAKEVAAAVAKRTSQVALCAFLATLIGLAAAGGGAVFGRACVCRRDRVGYYPSRPSGVVEKSRDSAGLTRSVR